MIEFAGGKDALGRKRTPSFRVTAEEIVAADPEILLIAQCGYNATQARAEYLAMPYPEGWNDMSAVRNSRVYALDATSYLSRPGPRLITGISEFDRVCGSGLVPGSALLIGGDPGIGKSPLLLQVAAALAQRGVGCAYISGEEALDQVRLRSARLGLQQTAVRLAAATSIRDIVATLEARDAPDVAVIDSIQTMWLDTVDSVPGTVKSTSERPRSTPSISSRNSPNRRKDTPWPSASTIAWAVGWI